MPRHPRVHSEGLLYHVMVRGDDGQKNFLGESDYQAFIDALRTVRQRYSFSLYAYVLMPNHFHLLLEVHRFPTARILQSLLTGYARPWLISGPAMIDESNIPGFKQRLEI